MSEEPGSRQCERADQNPYASSLEAVVNRQAGGRDFRKGLFCWRTYLLIHLLSVAAASVWITADTATHTHRGTWRDVVLPWSDVAYPVALAGIPLACSSPVVIITLLVLANQRGRGYVIAAALEFVLMLAHFYALLPAVQ